MERHHHHFFPFLVIMLSLVVVLTSFLVLQPRISGQITAVGGQITSLNVQSNVIAGSWLGVYGNITNVSTNESFSLSGGQVLPLELYYENSFTNDTVIAVTLGNITDWSNVTVATHAQINAFLGVVTGNAQSSENTLQEVANISVNNVVYETLAVTTVSVNGTYRTHALFVNNTLVFATTPVNGLGFDNSPIDFQLLIPVVGTMNVSFFVFEQSNPPFSGPLSCNATINLTAILASDNSSVRLSWQPVSSASGYELLYIDGPLNGQLDFTNNTVVPMGLSRTWTDNNPSAERYYKVRVLSDNASCEVDEFVGTLEQNLTPDYNLVSTPFVNSNNSIAETLRSIDGDYSSILELDNILKSYKFYLIVGENVLKNFDNLTAGKGYWIRTTTNTSLRLVGSLVTMTNESLAPDYNLVGLPVIDNVDHNSSIEYVLSSIDGDYSSILELDNILKSYKFYLIVGENVLKNFDNLTAGKGYWIRTTTDTNLTYVNG